ncbi:S-adenosyl-L-methionine-dependent methyltransferase [Flammula alnicola]|nr:S-adenosyl-L-methionine-dependent methyltransferase [Flammula alnicola]
MPTTAIGKAIAKPHTTHFQASTGKLDMTVIEQHLLDRIKLTGPLPFATYMQQCLSHPTHGYYMNPENRVFGSRGDFITSPEISQMFGELVAVWLLSQYEIAGKQSSLRFIELGPGKGTLMGDILRARKHINVHLVETSPSMRATQQAYLTSISNERPHVHLHWHNSINEIPTSSSEYTMLVAHEFFDALPIHILQVYFPGILAAICSNFAQQKAETGQWHEVLVASNIDQETTSNDDSNGSNETEKATPAPSFRRVLAPQPSAISTVLGHSSPRFQELPAGSSLEPEDEKPSLGGSGLIIDYGGNNAFGYSFRAFKSHNIVDVFHEPGNCDLTANVDFAYLKEAMGDLVTTHGPMPQGTFLKEMGLPLRLQGLLKTAKTEERREEIRGAAVRLVDPLGMGKEYQVLGITSEPPSPKTPEARATWPFVDTKP